MNQLIAALVMLASLGGIVFLLWRKIPRLLELPERARTAGSETGKDVGGVVRLQPAKPRKLLVATLTKTRSLASKTEVQASKLLEKLRAQSEARKEEFKESYWDRLRKKKK